MLIGVILTVKVNWKGKTCSLHCHFFNKFEFEPNDYLALILLFLKKIVAVAVLHRFVDQTSLL